jgi:hypothetical protein
VHVVAGLALDGPDGFLTYGAVGVWVVLVSWLGRRDRVLPERLCWLGFVAALTYFAGVLGYTLRVHALLVIAVGVGGLIIVPAWFGWMGVLLRRRARE